jgi:long-subunit fatty acid transport protein
MIGAVDLRITSVGGAIGFRVTNQLSLGVGVADYGYTQNARVTRYGLNGDLNLSPPDYSAANAVTEETVKGDDHTFAFNGGILWKPSRSLSVGAVYRQGPKFDATATAKALNPEVDVLAAPATFHVPDVFGVGLAFSPIEALTITADYDRVFYSQLTKTVIDTRYAGIVPPAVDTTAYEIADGNEGHLGIQYVIPLGSVALALRGGTWYDPDHQIRYALTSSRGEDLVFRGGKGVWHGTGGFGAAFGEHFQIDMAGDYASTVTIGSVSAVFRF